MEIQHEHLKTKGDFFILDDQHKKIALMTYHMIDEKTMVIEHTEVQQVLEGKGIARKLVDAGVQFARESGFKIIPQCPYAASVFRKTPEYSDVLAGY